MAGAEPRDISEYSAWRMETDAIVLEGFWMYGTYLNGQTNGMSDALSLPSVVAAFDLEGVPQEERPEKTWVLLRIHSDVLEATKPAPGSLPHG
jgi:hypothetical protein